VRSKFIPNPFFYHPFVFCYRWEDSVFPCFFPADFLVVHVPFSTSSMLYVPIFDCPPQFLLPARVVAFLFLLIFRLDAFRSLWRRLRFPRFRGFLISLRLVPPLPPPLYCLRFSYKNRVSSLQLPSPPLVLTPRLVKFRRCNIHDHPTATLPYHPKSVKIRELFSRPVTFSGFNCFNLFDDLSTCEVGHGVPPVPALFCFPSPRLAGSITFFPERLFGRCKHDLFPPWVPRIISAGLGSFPPSAFLDPTFFL